MIITVDPSQSEDIAAFAMVKQYRMQALNVTLNGGTGSSAWQAVQGGEGYTQTVVTPVTGIELVYEDPNAIVSYTVENDDTSNYDAASNAGIILSSIEPTTNAWTYTCVFHADSVPVSSVDIDLLVYGNIARGTEQQGSPATAEEITAQVLAGLETRVTALEEEMPDKADKATTLAGYGITDAYTKTEADTLLGAKANDDAVVKLTGNQDVDGVKTFIKEIRRRGAEIGGTTASYDIMRGYSEGGTRLWEICSTSRGDNTTRLYVNTRKTDGTFETVVLSDGGLDPSTKVATLGYIDGYLPMVRTANAQTIAGIKTFNSEIIRHSTGNFIRGFTFRQNVFTEGSAPSENRTQWPFIVSNDAINAYPFMIGITQESSGRAYSLLQFINPTNNKQCRLDLTCGLTGDSYLNLFNNSSWSKVATIATLDGYGPMVRTTGNQTLQAKKTFNELEAANLHGTLVGYMPAVNTGGYKKLLKIKVGVYRGVVLDVFTGGGAPNMTYKHVFVSRRQNPERAVILCNESWGYESIEYSMWALYNTDGSIDVYASESASQNTNIYVNSYIYGSGYSTAESYLSSIEMIPESDLVHLDALPAGCVQMVKTTNFMA